MNLKKHIFMLYSWAWSRKRNVFQKRLIYFMQYRFIPLSLSLCVLLGLCACEKKTDQTFPEKKPSGVIFGNGFVRGISMTTLKNKYASFVKKVHVYSHKRVKKGQLILEYDDHTLRTQIAKLNHEIAELEKTLDQKKLSLKIKQIDPLPSDYRNILWKQFAAEQLQKRLHHESKVYRSLFHKQALSELDYLRKQEEFECADAEFKRLAADRKRVLKGLDKLYIRSVEMDIELLQLKIANRRAECALLEEERKYYRITAPYDGYCITNSDTVHGYDAAGTAAVSVHKDHKKIIYAYFDEDHINLIHEGMKGRFRSSQHGLKYGYFPVTVTEVKRGRTVTADRNIFLVKFRIDKEIVPLRIESAGRVELVLQ